MKGDVYLLDTDTIIYWLKDKFPKIKYKISQSDKDCLFTSSITVAELYFGAYNSSRKIKNLNLLKRLFSQYESLAFDDNASKFMEKSVQNSKLRVRR
jgi:tRNA(fMet)-specific endonuclease VapC